MSPALVRGIRGTVMPLRSSRLRWRVKLSGREARAIARRRITDADSAGPAQLVAYAGSPKRPRGPRRAYVVPVGTESTTAGDDAPEPLCVVVDAASGRVLETWRGSIAQPASRRPARPSTAGAGPTARAAATQVLAQYADAKGSASEALPFDGRDLVINTTNVAGNNYDSRAFLTSRARSSTWKTVLGAHRQRDLGRTQPTSSAGPTSATKSTRRSSMPA